MARTRAKGTARAKATGRSAASGKGDARRKSGKTGNGLSAEAKLAELRRRLLEISDLSNAGAVLGWDQATYMPKGGAAARARQGATLSRLAHEKFTDPAVGRLLDGLAAYAARQPYESDDASLIRIVRRDYEKATKVPSDFVSRWSEMGSASYDVWTRARPANDFATMRPYLEKALDFSRRFADYLGPYAHIADPLIDGPDEGMTVATVRALFTELRAELVPIVRAIAEQPVADDSCLRGAFPEQKQLDFGLTPIKRFGYDFDRGRLDKTHHPFCTKFSAGDVRITTRVRENEIGEALFSTLHETGHALYEQGVDARYEGTPLNSGTSAGVHESQSRLWENVVGRSRGFWEYFYPKLCDAFPDHFGQVPLETFYRAINKVERSLIRTDADEVTYNLHVMLRFDLELDLLEGRLKVKDLPAAWRARFKADFGIVAARRPRRLPAGRPLVRRQRRRRVPGLHHRQHPERAVLCGGLEGAPGDPTGDYQGRVRHAAQVAHEEALQIWPQVRPERDRQARYRQADDHRPLHRLPARQVRRALSPAELMALFLT